MAHQIHRRGDKYRLWSTVTDGYLTPPLTKTEIRRRIISWSMQDYERNLNQEVDVQLARASKQGTSSRLGTRDTTKWETERCQKCACFHHAFEVRLSDGNCGVCGEPKVQASHGGPC